MVKQNSSGQTLLIILLIMAVALTIGLSVISRSITDIRISQEQEESARAFSAAEAGLEHYLATGTAPSADLIEGFDVTATKSDLGGTNVYVFPKEIRAGDTQTVWLVSHDGDNLQSDFGGFTDIIFYWGKESITGQLPALEAVIIYTTSAGGQYRTRRVAFDPNPSRAAGNDFTNNTVGTAGYSLDEKKFSYRVKFSEDNDEDFPVGNKFYALRIKLLYNDQPQILGVEATDDDFPLQGNCYRVEAQSAETNITRKVEQCQLYKSPPAIFDYVLFSEDDLTR